MENQKHHLLPSTGTPEQTAQFLINNARETFTDEQKVLFTEQDINDMARQSSGAGAEILGLKAILTEVTEAVTKGYAGDAPLQITVYPTSGTKALDKQRAGLDADVKKGYNLVERTIYGLPCDVSNEMVFFDALGTEIKDRNRPLSAREKHEYFGMFVDHSTGELTQSTRAMRAAI